VPPPPNGKGVVEVLGEVVQLADERVCYICGALMVHSGCSHRSMTCGSTATAAVARQTTVKTAPRRELLRRKN